MKTEAEFKDYFLVQIEPMLKGSNSVFVAAKTNRQLAGLLTVFTRIVWLIARTSLSLPFTIIMLFFGSAMEAGNDKLIKSSEDFKDKHFDVVLKKLVEFFGDFNYGNRPIINEQTLEISELISDTSKRYFNDKVEGYLGNTHVKCCTLEYSDDDHASLSSIWRDSKAGCSRFLFANFNKDFDGHTLVFAKKKVWLGLPNILTMWGLRAYKRIYLEDSGFNKQFLTYTSNPQEARYILTPVLMQNMLHIKTELKTSINFSFIRSYIFINHPVSNSLYNGFMNGGQSYQDYKSLFISLNTALGIIEELNLNRRIWTTGL